MKSSTVSIVCKLALASLALAGVTSAGLIATRVHVYGFGADPSAVTITLRLFDDQPGGRYLWQYTVENDSYDSVPGTTNGFSGFELFLPSPIPEIADITPGPASVPPWEHNCCSGLPLEWDIKNSDGNGVMPGQSLIFSFTTDPRKIGINDNGWFHTWQFDGQSDIVETPGMHVPLVPGLRPEVPEPTTWGLIALGLTTIAVARRRARRA